MTDQTPNEPPTPPAARVASRDLLSPLAIIVAGLMVSGSIVWSSWQAAHLSGPESIAASSTAEPAPPPPPAADIAKVKIDGQPFIGDVNAPVVMAYWFDYQCPYCRQVEENVFPQLIKDYVEAGKVRIVFKDFQFLGPDSQTAGVAARAVWEVAPDKFREWHKAMFDNQDDENSGWGKKDDIIALTKTIPGIDAAKVEEVMNTRTVPFQTAMQADAAEGNAMGVGGTPSFLIGKRMTVGAAPYEQLKSEIDGVLSAM